MKRSSPPLIAPLPQAGRISSTSRPRRTHRHRSMTFPQKFIAGPITSRAMAALPFDPDKLGPAERAVFDRLKARRAAVGAPFSGPYLALMNHPDLTEKIEALGYLLKFEGSLPRDVYQFAVLMVARACRAPFEWIDHVGHARAAGVPDEVIESIRSGRDTQVESYATAAPVIHAVFSWSDVPEAAQA